MREPEKEWKSGNEKDFTGEIERRRERVRKRRCQSEKRERNRERKGKSV